MITPAIFAICHVTLVTLHSTIRHIQMRTGQRFI